MIAIVVAKKNLRLVKKKAYLKQIYKIKFVFISINFGGLMLGRRLGLGVGKGVVAGPYLEIYDGGQARKIK